MSCREKYISSKATLVRNQRKTLETADVIYCCRFCDEKFVTKHQLKEHCSEKHSNTINTYQCPYCGKEFIKRQQLGGHISHCKLNPNHEKYIHILENLHDNNRRLAKEGKIKGHPASPETKAKLSNIRTKLYAEGVGLGGMQSRTYKLPNINGEMFFHQGTWELNVAKYLNSKNILWIRNKKIQYIKDNFVHNYIPDYYVANNDVYVEVKGYFSPDAQLKMKLVLEQNPNIKIYFIHDNYKDFISGKIPFNDELCLTLEYLKEYNS